MSVAYLSCHELAVLAAVSVKLKLQSLGDACAMSELMSISNCAAYADQYGEFEVHHSADDIELAALKILSTPGSLPDHFGPVVYNCVTNSGSLYVGPMAYAHNQLTDDARQIVEDWNRIEDACRKWTDSEQRRIDRQAEDDESFADVGPLPKLTADELRAKMAECNGTRLIIAEFRVNESDGYTDYYGCRAARRVVIGFGTGSRESFVQMRKAAAQFPPTAHYAPGCDIYTCRVTFTNDVTNNGNAFWKGSRSPHHKSIGNGTTFPTREQAEQFIAEAGTPHTIGFGGVTGEFEWSISVESYENRENYSMGGGNYLGTSRYGGWQVKMTTYFEDLEYFEAPRKASDKKPRRSPAPKHPSQPIDTIASQYAANV